MPRQIPLPGFATVAGSEEQTYRHLACEWRDEIAGVERGRPPPHRVDEISLAALLLAFEHGRRFSSTAWQDADRNTKSCQHVYLPWLDQLPWLLGHGSCSDASDHVAIRQLVGNLNHGNSSIRIWMMEVAWMIRGALPREEVIPVLLENVASTLTKVDMAWGLAESLCDSREEFLLRATSFAPADFATQYADRVAELRNWSSIRAQADFWHLESRCRRLIAEAAMNLARSVLGGSDRLLIGALASPSEGSVQLFLTG